MPVAACWVWGKVGICNSLTSRLLLFQPLIETSLTTPSNHRTWSLDDGAILGTIEVVIALGHRDAGQPHTREFTPDITEACSAFPAEKESRIEQQCRCIVWTESRSHTGRQNCDWAGKSVQ